MVALVKSLVSSFGGKDVPVKARMKKQGVKPAVSRQQKERSAMIDRMVSSLGVDYDARRRYFQLS